LVLPTLAAPPGGLETAQRAVNDFCSPGSGKSQTTARARTSRLNAVFAAAPQGQFKLQRLALGPASLPRLAGQRDRLRLAFAAKKRELALEAMCEVGLKKLEEPDFMASARAGLPPLLILAEPEIPEPYWVPQPPKLDRQSLLADLKRGVMIQGAQLGNPKPCLAVRTK
jgi:hypothetical protein